mgnify:CR=1 FL=1
MTWSASVRQVHRWVSIVFTLSVIAVSVFGAVQEDPAQWVFLVPGAFLILLLLTGLNLFALPYTRRRRASRNANEAGRP